MKCYLLIFILGLSGVFLSAMTAQSATTVTTDYQTVNPSQNLNGSNKPAGNGNYLGFTFSFNDLNNAQTTSNGAAVTNLPETFTLDSLSLYTRASSISHYQGEFKIALCVFSADGSAGQLISVSSNTNTSTGANKEMKFTFDTDIILDSSQTIQVLFVKSGTTVETWDWNNDKLSQRVGLSVLQSGSNLPSGCGTYTTDLNHWEGQYLPKMTINLHTTETIPEPTTAALGLVSLAAFFARRRRA